MTISSWLMATMKKLGEAGVDSPRRDALVLLEDTLDKDRSWVLAHTDSEIKKNDLEHVNSLVDRRIQREPLAYIRGKAWFYGRFFEVNPDVLIPRPESETIIDIAKELAPTTIVDVGTGSGCLAITLALELPEAHVSATDVSHEAIEIARANTYHHKARIEIHNTYLLEGLLDQHSPDLIVANLPYVPDDFVVSPEVESEPKLAIYAGQDGMDSYRSLWAQLSTSHHNPKFVITESLETQHSKMNELAVKSGYRLAHTEHLIQLWKFDESVST
jgi:release factor glutamine methyltransferase